MCLNVHESPERFGNWSGLEINTQKSGLFFSKEVKVNTKSNIKSILDMKKLPQDCEYLGNPLFLKRRKSESFGFILDKIKPKLLSWTGRSTLAS